MSICSYKELWDLLLYLSSLMDFPSCSKSQRPHSSISLRRKMAFSQSFRLLSLLYNSMRFQLPSRQSSELEGKTNRIFPNNHLTIEVPFMDSVSRVTDSLSGLQVSAPPLVLWQCSSLSGAYLQAELEKEKRGEKSEISLTLSLGSHLPHQKDIQVTLWGDSHGGQLRSLTTGNKISCQQL